MICRHTPREGPHNPPGHRQSAATRCRLSPCRCKLESVRGGQPPLAASRQRPAADGARSLQAEIDPRPMDIVALHADIDWMSLDIVPLPAGRDSHSDDRASPQTDGERMPVDNAPLPADNDPMSVDGDPRQADLHRITVDRAPLQAGREPMSVDIATRPACNDPTEDDFRRVQAALFRCQVTRACCEPAGSRRQFPPRVCTNLQNEAASRSGKSSCRIIFDDEAFLSPANQMVSPPAGAPRGLPGTFRGSPSSG
jgi:hypothetical protein